MTTPMTDCSTPTPNATPYSISINDQLPALVNNKVSHLITPNMSRADQRVVAKDMSSRFTELLQSLGDNLPPSSQIHSFFPYKVELDMQASSIGSRTASATPVLMRDLQDEHLKYPETFSIKNTKLVSIESGEAVVAQNSNIPELPRKLWQENEEIKNGKYESDVRNTCNKSHKINEAKRVTSKLEQIMCLINDIIGDIDQECLKHKILVDFQLSVKKDFNKMHNKLIEVNELNDKMHQKLIKITKENIFMRDRLKKFEDELMVHYTGKHDNNHNSPNIFRGTSFSSTSPSSTMPLENPKLGQCHSSLPPIPLYPIPTFSPLSMVSVSTEDFKHPLDDKLLAIERRENQRLMAENEQLRIRLSQKNMVDLGNEINGTLNNVYCFAAVDNGWKAFESENILSRMYDDIEEDLLKLEFQIFSVAEVNDTRLKFSTVTGRKWKHMINEAVMHSHKIQLQMKITEICKKRNVRFRKKFLHAFVTCLDMLAFDARMIFFQFSDRNRNVVHQSFKLLFSMFSFFDCNSILF